MIHTAKQLKDKVGNVSKGDNDIAKMMIRNYFMERFLERVSCSPYKNHIVLKGGMLVASIVGVDMRATMDIDTTISALSIDEDNARRVITEICDISIDDGVNFHITSVSDIMTDFEYPGIRMMIEGTLERIRQPIKIDISTDDVITPRAIGYKYKLMFEDRSIELLSYNIETLLAEKAQTVIARGIANTRLRDYYDIYEIMTTQKDNIDKSVLKKAFAATCEKRDTVFSDDVISKTLDTIVGNSGMAQMWNKYKKYNYYVHDISWEEVSRYDTDMIKKYFTL